MKLPLLTALCFSASIIYAQDAYKEAFLRKPNIINGKQVYQLCAACHLQNGLGKKNGSFPVIASQHKSVIIKQLRDIQNKHRKNPAMYPFSDVKTIGGMQSISDVAAYIQSLPSDDSNGIGPGNNLDLGKQLYVKNCITCHDVEGQGNAQFVFPRIKDQHYYYLLHQLKWIRDGYRTNANKKMFALIKPMSNKELSSLADYISRF